MKKLIPLLLLAVMFTAGCDLAGISITTQPPVISSFGASPESISAGASSTLNWSVIGATTISIDQGIGNVALAGSRVVTPVATTVYTLTAANSSGLSATATAQVIVSGGTTPTPTPMPTPTGLPVINYFTASPSSVYAGEQSVLNWNVSNATSIAVDNGVGTVTGSGNTWVFPATTTTYTMTATNQSGWATKSVTVFVSGSQSSFAVTSVTVTPDPPFYTGACPTSANFYAVITVNGPGTVRYNWERSDGAFSRIVTLVFDGPGSQTVGTDWTFHETGPYWERVHVSTPNEIVSNQASFTLSCALAPGGIWAGTWETTYGTMVLTQTGSNVSGTYEHSNGHIVGTVSGGVLTGTWSEAPTYLPPDDAGDFQFTISPSGTTFTGGWRYGSSGSWTMNWNGTTIF